MTNPIFRPCAPDDVEQAVPLIYSSGPDAFSYVFKTDKYKATDFLSFAFSRKGGEFSYDNHQALLVGHKVVGIGAVFSSLEARRFTLSDFWNIILFYGLGCIPVLIRGLKIEQKIRLPIKNEICLAHLGITPELRSKGLGQKLMDYLISISNKKTQDYFILDVSEDNPRAKQLYDKEGFIVSRYVPSSLKSKHGHVPNHFRMELRDAGS